MSESNDVPSTGLNILCFLIPIVGLIVYLSMKGSKPIKAGSAGKAALWGFGIGLVFNIISMAG